MTSPSRPDSGSRSPKKPIYASSDEPEISNKRQRIARHPSTSPEGTPKSRPLSPKFSKLVERISRPTHASILRSVRQKHSHSGPSSPTLEENSTNEEVFQCKTCLQRNCTTEDHSVLFRLSTEGMQPRVQQVLTRDYSYDPTLQRVIDLLSEEVLEKDLSQLQAKNDDRNRKTLTQSGTQATNQKVPKVTENTQQLDTVRRSPQKDNLSTTLESTSTAIYQDLGARQYITRNPISKRNVSESIYTTKHEKHNNLAQGFIPHKGSPSYNVNTKEFNNRPLMVMTKQLLTFQPHTSKIYKSQK